MSDTSLQEPSKPDSTEDPETFFRGTVARITFRSSDTGFTVVRADGEAASASPGQTTVIGVFPSSVSPGTTFVARGEWQTHPKFGRQFRARSVTETEPTTEDALVRFLGSGAIKGLGPVLAERIVQEFGEDTIKIFDEDPQRLRNVAGVGEKKLEEVLASWEERRALRDVLLFFQKYNISLSITQRIFNIYKNRAIEVVRENPYILAKEVWGIGFQTADKIAQSLGIARDSQQRVSAGLAYILSRAADDGHCYLPKEKLIARTDKLLEIDNVPVIEQVLSQNILETSVIEELGDVYLPKYHQAEQELANEVSIRLSGVHKPEKEVPDELIEEWCTKSILSPTVSGPTPEVVLPSDEQQRALRYAADEALTVITGGPGCGKTTVLRLIVGLFRHAGLRVKLAAPTGRAAQRMAEVCEMPASTIHRLLKFDPMRREFVHCREDPLELDALIVDESSMIDLLLARSLFLAVPPTARIIVVGDADQLPSVGPGIVLSDLLAVPEISRIRLTKLFRREEQSRISQIAHEINTGNVPDIPKPDGVTKSDAYFLEAANALDASNLVERLVTDVVPRKFGISGRDITVLTPMNQGEIGVISLNNKLQNKLVPRTPGTPSVKVGDLEMRLGDRICQRVNNYNITEAGVFNGDQGEIIGIDAEARKVVVKLWDGREVDYEPSDLPQLDLAYVLTVHRSQGSEVPAVILILHDSHHILLERQLVYTGITRAKQLLVVVGTKKALMTACRRVGGKVRYTSLARRIVDRINKQEKFGD